MIPLIDRLRTRWSSPAGSLGQRVGLGVFVLVAAGGLAGVSSIRASVRQQQEQKVRAVAGASAAALENAVKQASSVALLIATQVERGRGEIDHFAALVERLRSNFSAVSAVGLAPGGVITQVEPLESNRGALGHDLLADQHQADEAWRTRDSRALTLAGPLQLAQGGEGIVARYPVFLDGAVGESQFWGFTYAVIRVPELMAQVETVVAAEAAGRYELWRSHPLTGQRQRIRGQDLRGVPTSDFPLALPNVKWTLSVDLRPDAAAWWMAAHGAVLVFALLLGLVTKLLVDLSAQRRLLQAEVARRTADSRYRETLFARLFHTSSVMLTLTSIEDGRFLEFNESFLSRTGFTRDDLTGQTTVSVGLLRPEVRREFVERLRKEQRLFRPDVVVFGKDGEGIHVQYHAELVSVEGQTCIITTWIDQTGQRAADETLRLQISALEAAANAIIVANRDGRIVWANAASSAQTGYDVGEMFGKTPGALFRSGVHDAAFYAAMRATLAAGKVWQAEMTNRRRDGTLIVEDVTITPLKNSGGEITHFIAVKQDVTERRALEDQVRRAQRLEAVGLLAGGVAHDFNNILAAVLMTLEICEGEGDVGPVPRSFLRELRKNVQRGATLTRQLLTFSRHDPMEIQVVEINALLTELLKMLRRLIPANISIATELAENLPSVRGDPGMIEQVITNLCVNARDAMPEGGRIVLATSLEPPGHPGGDQTGDSRVVISVRDSGCGMDAPTLAKIFDPFFTTKPVGKGTGLGLSTAYGIVRQHGGEIRVTSEVGRGTSFEVALPSWRGETAGASRTAAEEPASSPVQSGCRVLLVEDDETVRSVMATALRRNGHRVVEAGDAMAALQASDQTELDAIVTDVMMPGELSGPELLLKLRARQPRLPAVICSGYSAELASPAPVEDERTVFLRKPFSTTELVGALEAVLSGAARTHRG